ncbi:Ig-like domain-containing protein [Marinobacter sp. MIT932201]|uniref:Ig-like domain-containing protein n=1 Tax=Marinobacter sp. MIT932201 TaxID=3096995 RepID=UPI0039997496
MANFVTDTFTASGGTGTPPRIELVNHTGDTGHSWDATFDLRVRTDTDVVGSGVGANSYEYATASITPPSANYRVSLDVDVLTGADFTAAGPGARITGANRDSGYFASVDPNEALVVLERHDAGVRTPLGTPFDISDILLLDPINVEIVCDGDQISAKVNGTTQIGPVTDTTYSSAGSVGFYLRAGGTEFETIIADNFSADTLAAVSAPTLSSVPATAYPGETITITGSGLTGASADFGGETASVTVNSDTEIEITIAQGDLPFGTDTLTVTTSGGSATDDIDLIVEPGTGGYVDVVDPAAADTSSLAYQFEAAGGDPVATGDQCQWRYTGVGGDPTSMTVQPDTLVSALDAEGDVDVRFWDATDSTWGSWTELSASATDTTPDQFDLGANVTGAEPGATVQRTFVLAGIDSGETVTVNATGSATRSPATAQVGDTITVELTAGAFEAVVSGGVTINGVSGSFSVTSRAAVLPTQDVALPDLSLGETDAVSIDLDGYFSGASSYTLTGIPTDSGLSFSGSVLSGNVNKDDIAGSPYTLTATAFSAEGSIQDSFSVTVVDDIAPAVTIGDLTTLNTTPTAVGSAGDATGLTLVVEGVDVTHTSSYNPTPSNGSWAQQLDELAIGTYTMTLTGTDDAGNEKVVTATLNVVDEIITSPRGLFQPLFRSLTGSVNQTLFR